MKNNIVLKITQREGGLIPATIIIYINDTSNSHKQNTSFDFIIKYNINLVIRKKNVSGVIVLLFIDLHILF